MNTHICPDAGMSLRIANDGMFTFLLLRQSGLRCKYWHDRQKMEQESVRRDHFEELPEPASTLKTLNNAKHP